MAHSEAEELDAPLNNMFKDFTRKTSISSPGLLGLNSALVH